MNKFKSGSKYTTCIYNKNHRLAFTAGGSPNILLYLIPFARVTVIIAPDLDVSVMSCRIPSATLSGLENRKGGKPLKFSVKITSIKNFKYNRRKYTVELLPYGHHWDHL